MLLLGCVVGLWWAVVSFSFLLRFNFLDSMRHYLFVEVGRGLRHHHTLFTLWRWGEENRDKKSLVLVALTDIIFLRMGSQFFASVLLSPGLGVGHY